MVPFLSKMVVVYQIDKYLLTKVMLLQHVKESFYCLLLLQNHHYFYHLNSFSNII